MNKRPEESLAGMIEALKEKTGKTLEEWHAVIDGTVHKKHGEILNFLKTAHGVSHGYANQIALKIRDRREGVANTRSDPVDAMFTGAKAAARPLYDVVMPILRELGKDVDIAPKKAYVSVRRSKQFAIVQPAAGRLDVGINLKGVKPAGRLEASGSFNAMVTHRVKVASIAEVDDELRGWLKAAYDAA